MEFIILAAGAICRNGFMLWLKSDQYWDKTWLTFWRTFDFWGIKLVLVKVTDATSLHDCRTLMLNGCGFHWMPRMEPLIQLIIKQRFSSISCKEQCFPHAVYGFIKKKRFDSHTGNSLAPGTKGTWLSSLYKNDMSAGCPAHTVLYTFLFSQKNKQTSKKKKKRSQTNLV